ncbi:MAG: hypothetical protein GX430_04195 [Treponema sp.]|nr:hypothetical protein [Treponema sp.]
MPIKPIDLQTLFMQMNQVSKEQAAAKDGAVLQQSIQGAVLQKKREDEVRSVQKPQADEGAARIGDRESGSAPGGETESRKRSKDTEEPEEPEIVKDPDLGRRIDIQG